ncbi:MAG: SpoIIE family protein phosphatase [Deltaproteobacteria bacterium]|nr:SpoIIE family protein phosphatase [Deltaproteobacteria bacterium]
MPKLITLGGATRRTEHPFEDVCLLGRTAQCLVYLGDLSVSREHARIVKVPDGYQIEDLGSGNGTFVNGQRATRRMLADGDEVMVGNFLFRFEADAAPKKMLQNVLTVVPDDHGALIATMTEAKLALAPPGLERLQTKSQMETELAQAYRMLEATYAVTSAIASILEPEKLFNTILESLFNVFPNAARGFILLLDERQQLVPAAILQRRATMATEGLTISQTVVAEVLGGGQSVLSQGAGADRTGAVSRICAPLVARGQTLGILHIEGKRGMPSFSNAELQLLTGIATQAGIAIANAQLHQQLMSQQRLEMDLRFARRVQESFLPFGPPEVPGYLFDRNYQPLYWVGGDFYDFITTSSDRVGVVIGDVTGKGVSAALLMARLTSDIRHYSTAEASPASVLGWLNENLLLTGQDDMFATVLYLVLDPATGVVTFCNAGHLRPLLRQVDGEVIELEGPSNMAVGVLPDQDFQEQSLELLPGECILLCTDGVAEAKNSAQDEFGMHRTGRAFAASPPEHAIASVLRELQRHAGTESQYDDITLVSILRHE